MPSPRFEGPAEKMGTVTQLPTAEIYDEELVRGELDVARLLAGVEIGSVALLDAEFELPKTPEQPVRATFIEVPDFGIGRDEAKHQPRFGQMMINGRGLHERPVFVTAKPFNGKEDVDPVRLLTREWAANNFLNSLDDRQLAYLPLGVWRSAKGVNHLITLYEHGVISYDNTFWADRDASPEALRPEAVEHALVDCIQGLGYLHGVGLVHGDAEAKNLAANNSGMRFIDTEDMRLLPRKGSVVDDSPEVKELARKDLDAFLSSTLQVDENREMIAPVLAKTKMDNKLAAIYQFGLRTGQAEASIKFPRSAIATPGDFRQLLNRTLRAANPQTA